MNLNLICLLAFFTISYAHAQDTKTEHKTDQARAKHSIRSSGAIKDIASLDEGFNEFEGGLFAIKDYLVRGNVTLIRVSYGTRVSSPNYRDWQNKKKYYLLKGDDEHREIFLTNQNPSATSTLAFGGMATRQSLNNRKFTGSMLTSSQTTLRELMGDKAEILKNIDGLKKITEANMRKLVKAYNQ